MYLPEHNREDRLEAQHQLIQSHPLGLLISTDAGRLVANAIPFLLDRGRGARGTLLAHMARANSQWRAIDQRDVLIVFQSIEKYITPSLLATKVETGKVVPTWNYAMVQVAGKARVHNDAMWLEQQVRSLTNHQERTQEQPWSVSDAPPSYIASQLRGIVGVEIEISDIQGKWKVGQDEPETDRRSISDGLLASDPVMAQLVRRYGKL